MCGLPLPIALPLLHLQHRAASLFVFLGGDKSGLIIHIGGCRLRVFDGADQRLGLVPDGLNPGLHIGFVVIDVLRCSGHTQIDTHEAGTHLRHQLLVSILRRAEQRPLRSVQPCGMAGGVRQFMECCGVEGVLAMSALEKFMNDEDGMDPLIKAALIHYQFETIHPFLDGNGRVGRLLITLFLMGVNELSSPVLYLSCFLKLNRIEYYDRMSEVRKAGNYEQWVKFFLRGIAETAEDATETIDRLNALHQKNEAKLADVPTRSRHNIMRLLAYIEQNPIIETVKTASALGLSRNGTANYITMLCNRNILKYSAKSGKALVFAYEEYLDILRKDT